MWNSDAKKRTNKGGKTRFLLHFLIVVSPSLALNLFVNQSHVPLFGLREEPGAPAER